MEFTFYAVSLILSSILLKWLTTPAPSESPITLMVVRKRSLKMLVT